MPGQAIIRIRDREWQIALATTPWEQARGLGSISSIPPGTGMLFDLGYDRTITVTTMPMLFPLDIAFISDSLMVVDVGRDVPPGLVVSSSVPARFFLEVNAGELQGIDTGDRVYIQFLHGTAPQQIPDWVTAMFSFMGFAMAGMFMVAIARMFIKAAFAEPETKPVLYGSRGEKLLPQTKGEDLITEILQGLKGKEKAHRAYVKYPKDKSAFVTLGAIVGGHYSWNPQGFSVWVDAWQRNLDWPADSVLGIKELKGGVAFPATEQGVKDALDYITERFPTFTASTWVSKSIPIYVAQELGILKFGVLAQTTKELTTKWYGKGVEAGKTDGWMAVEDTLPETLRDHHDIIRDYKDLVWTDIDLWEQTEHFNDLYGSKIWKDAFEATGRDIDETIDVYSDLRAEFWEGYLTGRKQNGIDIYQKAKELLGSSVELLPQTQAGTATKLDGLQIVKAYKQIFRHGADKISVSLEAWAIFPRGKKPHFISMYRSGDKYIISPLYGHIRDWVEVPVDKVKAWVKTLPVRHFEPSAVAPQYREEAERLAKEVDEPIDIIPLPSRKGASTYMPGEIAEYKGKRVRVREHIGGRVQILIPSRQEEVWVEEGKLKKLELLPQTKSYEKIAYELLENSDFWFDIYRVKDLTGLSYEEASKVIDILANKEFLAKARAFYEGFRYPSRSAQIALENIEAIETKQFLPQTSLRKERERALIKLAAKVRRKRDEFEASLKAIGIDPWYYRDTATREELHKIWEEHPHIPALDEELYKLQQEYNKLMLSPFGYPGEEEEEEEEETEEMPQTTKDINMPLQAVVPIEPFSRRRRESSKLKYFADSPEFLTQTVDSIGYREKIDKTFQEAIARAKGLKQWQ